ncbi:MAG: hypothetical protein FJ006_03260 [Chloroflexi bacterium]|nr:hypothetical protein [Chloroflexota bacterium]
MIFTIGLILIIAGWIVQLYRTLAKKDLQFNLVFLSLYVAGCFLLAIATFMQKDVISATLQLICTILPLIVLAAVIRLKKGA